MTLWGTVSLGRAGPSCATMRAHQGWDSANEPPLPHTHTHTRTHGHAGGHHPDGGGGRRQPRTGGHPADGGRRPQPVQHGTQPAPAVGTASRGGGRARPGRGGRGGGAAAHRACHAAGARWRRVTCCVLRHTRFHVLAPPTPFARRRLLNSQSWDPPSLLLFLAFTCSFLMNPPRRPARCRCRWL